MADGNVELYVKGKDEVGVVRSKAVSFFVSIMIKWVLGYYYEKEKNSFLGPRKATLRHLVSFSFSGGSVWMDTHGILFFFPLLCWFQLSYWHPLFRNLVS